MIGSRWARCWTLKADAPYWKGRDDAWPPGQGDEAADEVAAPPAPPAKERVARRFRLTPRRRIKRQR